jgi:hypothetical protein
LFRDCQRQKARNPARCQRLFQVERLGSRQADLATAESSKPAMPGHYLAAEDEVTSVVVPSLIDGGAICSQLQGDYAT